MSQECVISGLGAATSVGFGVADTAASVRVGFNRFQPIENIVSFDEDELEATVAGAPIPLLTKGFIQQARLLRLVESAFEDFLDYTKLDRNDQEFWQNTPIIWVISDPCDAFIWPEDQRDKLLYDYLLLPLQNRFNLPLETPRNGFFCEGASGGARAIRGILRSIHDGHLARAICISVDSLLEPMVLDGIITANRLKDNENPVGLIPGEAAAVVLLESLEACSTRNKGAEATMYNSYYKQLDIDLTNENWRRESATDIGRELAHGISEVLTVFGENVFFGDIFIDINGEEWRAISWGCAQVQLTASQCIDLDHCNIHAPAENVGDIGAASGVLSMCLAVRSFVRRYAKSPYSLVCTVSEYGNIGVMLIGK